MSFLAMIKRINVNPEERWFLKFHENGFIREVKQVYNAAEYRKQPHARLLLTKKKLIAALELDKLNRKNERLIDSK